MQGFSAFWKYIFPYFQKAAPPYWGSMAHIVFDRLEPGLAGAETDPGFFL